MTLKNVRKAYINILCFSQTQIDPFVSRCFNLWPLSLCKGHPRAVGTALTDLEHHQAGAEEEPAGRVGRLEVL